MNTNTIITMGGSRIITPKQFDAIRKELNPYYRVFVEGLLFSGLRPSELRRYAQNTQWRKSSTIALPDIPGTQIGRAVPLSYEGKYAMEVFDLVISKFGCRPRENVHQALHRAVAKMDKCGIGINESMFRKSWIAWVVATTPDEIGEIGRHFSCDTTPYRKIEFDPSDIDHMRKHVYGLSEGFIRRRKQNV